MLSCTEFIPAYSELFQVLEARGGRPAVDRFWEALSDNFLGSLGALAEEKGLEGCFEYWRGTLTEEAGDCRIRLDREKGEFTIEMRACPSKGRLLEMDHIEPYPAYCEHCDTLYRRVLEPLGFEYAIDLSRADTARCTLTVRRKKGADALPENKQR
jgi:hypothetical protein